MKTEVYQSGTNTFLREQKIKLRLFRQIQSRKANKTAFFGGICSTNYAKFISLTELSNGDNEAKGNAAVYCVIIGFGNFDIPVKRLFE